MGPHKNHETLFAGVARWGFKYPLVLTGPGTDFHCASGDGRLGQLLKLVQSLGFKIGENLIPLGYVSDAAYHELLSSSWALVTATLAEGTGSLPVSEALARGIPVVCSDIAPIREELARLGGPLVHSFDPTDPSALAATLGKLEQDYARYKSNALQQVDQLQQRSWGDVAMDYWALFNSGGHSAPAGARP
jgi:glycosyltransferase involved in cell wall biosynthesis